MTELATYTPGILLALSAVLLALMSPGPNILAVIGTSMGAGRKYGVALALGVATGSFCWALIAVSGLTAVLTAYAAVLTAIKIAGGCYLAGRAKLDLHRLRRSGAGTSASTRRRSTA